MLVGVDLINISRDCKAAVAHGVLLTTATFRQGALFRDQLLERQKSAGTPSNWPLHEENGTLSPDHNL